MKTKPYNNFISATQLKSYRGPRTISRQTTTVYAWAESNKLEGKESHTLLAIVVSGVNKTLYILAILTGLSCSVLVIHTVLKFDELKFEFM